MYKQAIVLSFMLLTPTVRNAAPAERATRVHGTRSGVLGGTILARRMATALSRQSRIEVRGSLGGPDRESVQYVIRYQAQGREYLQESGGIWEQVQVGKHSMGGMESVSVGRRLYSSTDGKHWMVGSRLVAPSALDTLSINPVMAPCCVPGKTAAAQVTNRGLSASRFGRVYTLNYIATSAMASIRGTLLIDARSYLPRRYTEYSLNPVLHGSFVLTYGGTFAIHAPLP